VRKLVVLVAIAATLALLSATTTLGALVSGSLPAAGFTWTSVSDNTVHSSGGGIRLQAPAGTNVKTTYSKIAPSSTFESGWHYHNGPVVVSVTVGTLTFFDAECNTWDVSAGHSYIESRGQVLNAKVLPSKNSGIATTEWFTTRLYPAGTVDPVNVANPCTGNSDD
jgi:hypothetical protein